MAEHTRGIDVSKHQAEINWDAVADAGYTFAYIKATEGVDYTSPALKRQVSGAREAGLAVGLYHFARPDTNTAEVEADWFARELTRFQGDDPSALSPCLDVEVEADGLPRWVEAFQGAFRNLNDRDDLLVYASATWFKRKLEPDTWVDDDTSLWVAHYDRTPGKPGYMSDRVALHQYRSDGDVPGVDGPVDVNVSLVDLDSLQGDSGAGSGLCGFFSRWLFR